jgi:hypothetical protein
MTEEQVACMLVIFLGMLAWELRESPLNATVAVMVAALAVSVVGIVVVLFLNEIFLLLGIDGVLASLAFLVLAYGLGRRARDRTARP